MRVPRILAVSALVVVSSAVHAQIAGTIRIVDGTTGPPPNGPFPTIQAAINAANSGDVILVKNNAAGGPYPAFNIGATGSTSLGITADTGATVVVQPSTIQNLAATDQVVIRGIEFNWTPTVGGVGTEILNNSGNVWFEDCSFTFFIPGTVPLPVGPGATVNVSGPGVVNFVRCAINGVDGYYGPGGTPYISASVGLRVTSAQVAVWESTVLGGKGASGSPLLPTGNPGAHGISQTFGALFFSDAMLQGGNGGNGTVSLGACGPGGNGGDGLHISTSSPDDSICSTFSGGAPGAGAPLPPANSCSAAGATGVGVGGVGASGLTLHPGSPRKVQSLNSPVRVAPAGTAHAWVELCAVLADLCRGWRDDTFRYFFDNRLPDPSGTPPGYLGLDQGTTSRTTVVETSVVGVSTACKNKAVVVSHSADLAGNQARAFLLYDDCLEQASNYVFYSSPTFVFLIDSAVAP